MNDELLKKYLSENTILIVDSVPSARTNLASALSKMGARLEKMILVGTIEEASAVINRVKPFFIFTDYTVGQGSGLDLIQNQQQVNGLKQEADPVFILVTGNGSQSAVARAAEEDVDTYILKPYSFNTLKFALLQILEQRVTPSLYLQLIEEGKAFLFKAEAEPAIEKFSKAMKEHPEPTLACFYYGQAELLRSALRAAEGKYQLGLSYNRIHYKCLVGMYDLLHSQSKFKEAYEIIRKIAKYFPANPKRLTEVLRLAILTENFDDVNGYYDVYLGIPERSDALIKHVCAALLVTGKYWLRKNLPGRAADTFEFAAVSSAGRTQFLVYIIEALVEFNLLELAKRFQQRLASAAPISKDFQIGKFLISTLEGSVVESVRLGEMIVRKGSEPYFVYEKLITQAARLGNQTMAKEFFADAMKKWPEKESKFKYALEVNLREQRARSSA